MCQLSDGLENSVEGKSYTKRCNTMGSTNTSYPKGNVSWGVQDTWFVTFTFAIAVGTHTAEGKIREWLRRLRQTLVLNEEDMFVSYLFAPQDRGVWHIHMEVKAEGLNRLSQQRWEEKWSEITGRRVVEEITKHETTRVPAIIRRREGCPDSVTYTRNVTINVMGENAHYIGGGTCKIRQVGQTYQGRRNQDYVCTREGIRHYLETRHSHDFNQDYNHNFLGIS
jgi:hypothetical protein